MRVEWTSVDTVKALQGLRKKKPAKAIAASAFQAIMVRVCTPFFIIEFKVSPNRIAIGMSLKISESPRNRHEWSPRFDKLGTPAIASSP